MTEVVRREMDRHSWDYFVEPVASSGRGVTVPGCPACKVRINTVNQFVDHLSEHVEAAIERAFGPTGS